MSSRLSATACTMLGLTLCATWTLWFAGGRTLGDAAEAYLLTNSVMALSFGACGMVVLAHRPRNVIGVLFLAYAAFMTTQSFTTSLMSGYLSMSDGTERALVIVANSVWIPALIVVLPLIVQLFPTGRAISPRWGWLVGATTAAGLLAGAALVTSEPLVDATLSEPILRGSARTAVVAALPTLTVMVATLSLVSLLTLALRFRRGTSIEREQVQWLILAVSVVTLVNLQRFVGADGPTLFLLTFPIIPAAVMIAIVRHQLWDIRVVINRTALYSLLTLGVVGLYAGTTAVIGLVATRGLEASPLIATAVVAVAFAPGRAALQHVVNRAMYGESRDPAATMSSVGAHLGTDLDSVLRAVRTSMRLPYAAIHSNGRILAEVGSPPGARHTVPLAVGHPAGADLMIGLRDGESTASAADRRTLEALAGPIAIAVRALQLGDELRESRSRIVNTREDERRRLRRDLHDGLGTTLTAIRLRADAASNVQSSDPARAAALLEGLRDDLSDAIADIRRIVYELRPPALDELGLVGALRQLSEQAWRRENRPFTVTIDAPSLGRLPAAVESAAFRIATESVTNTVRHSDALTCRVVLRCDESLYLDVRDNGHQDPGAWREGVGLQSMRERASELGGRVTAGPTVHGWLVHAELPIGAR